VIWKRPRRKTGVDKSRLAFPPVPASAGASREDRNLDRIVSVRGIRFRVMRRARRWFGNRCEFCRNDEPVTMHHVLKGSERRLFEDDATCAAICDLCDKRTEREENGVGGPAWARLRGLEWARRLAAAARSHGLRELAARFDQTAEILEAKIALARAKGGVA
jgi:hypothetical protein